MISIEEIVALVVREVILELSIRGIQVDEELLSNNCSTQKSETSKRRLKIEKSKYKTQLLTEVDILEIALDIEEIEIPKKTIITPSAFDLIRQRNIKITKIN